jgi:HTH-type transcriptional regulator/antitoxin HigA
MKPLKNEHAYQEALERIEELWGAASNTPEGDELEILMVLVEAYENKHYPIPPSDPVNAILFQMDQMGIDRKKLQEFLGPKSRVSDVLNRKRGLSVPQIKKLHKGMRIPYECLLGES